MKRSVLITIVIAVFAVIILGSVTIGSSNTLVNVEEDVDLSSSQVVSRLN